MSDRTKYIFSFVLILGSTLFTLFSAEFLVRHFYFSAEEAAQGAPGLFARERIQLGPTIAGFAPGCHMADTFVAHPHFGFVLNSELPCGVRPVNRQGFLGQDDFPVERDPNYFTILILGGSEAQIFGAGFLVPIHDPKPDGSTNPRWLERYLNDNFVAPNGKPFRVLNGGMQGSEFPTQTYVLEQFGHGVDAAISIDGYNEALYGKGLQFGAVPTEVYLPLIRAPEAMRAEFGIYLGQSLRDWFDDRPYLEKWFLSYFIFSNLRSVITEKIFLPALESVKRGTFGSRFFKPKSWSDEELVQHNVKRYVQSILLNESVAQHLGIRYAHFLQPLPQLKKPRSEAERAFTSQVPTALYEAYAAEVDRLGASGHDVFSLLNLFEKRPETLYLDHVHLNHDGNQLLAEKIAHTIKARWKLRDLRPIEEGRAF